MKLNLGCGGQRAKGWISVDREGPDLDYKFDLRRGLPFRDDEADLIVAHHVLDLIPANELDQLLAEIYRVLKPGGWFRISLFDILRAQERFSAQDLVWFVDRGYQPDDETHFVLALAGGFDWIIHQNGARRWVTTPFLLGRILESVGFTWERESYQRTAGPAELLTFDSREEESMFIDCHKGARA